MSSRSSSDDGPYYVGPIDPKPFGGLQSESRERTYWEMAPVYAYMCLAGTFVVLGAVTADMHFWIRYCGARISLLELYDGSYSVSLLEEIDNCDSAEDIDSCGEYCTNLRDLRTAGQLMRGMGITAVVLGAICMGLMLKPIKWKQGLVFKLLQVLAMVFWLAGTAAYGGHYSHVNSDASDTSIGPGLEIAIANTVLQAVCCLLGFIAYSRVV